MEIANMEMGEEGREDWREGRGGVGMWRHGILKMVEWEWRTFWMEEIKFTTNAKVYVWLEKTISTIWLKPTGRKRENYNYR